MKHVTGRQDAYVAALSRDSWLRTSVNQLQTTTKVYIGALLGLAVGLTFVALNSGTLPRPADIVVMVVAAGCTALAWLFPIHFASKTKLYADMAVMIAAVLLLPPAFAVVAVGSGTLL